MDQKDIAAQMEASVPAPVVAGLLVSERKLKAIFDAGGECIKVLKPDSTLCEINEAGLDLVEARDPEMLLDQQLIGTLVVEEDRARVEEWLQATIAGERKAVQYRMVGLKGTRRWVETRGAPFSDDATGETRVVAISRDITHERRIAAQLFRLNRLHAVSSAINQAIVRVGEIQALYTEACRIAVELGGLRMAWIAKPAPGGTRLQEAARWGYDAGYIDSLDLSTSEAEPGGQGPAGRAFRTRQPAVCPDVGDRSAHVLHREAALARGYRSCAAFPMQLEGEPIGLLMVYSDEPGYFEEEEVKVLKALGENLAFAAEMHRHAREREAAEQALAKSEAQLAAAQARARLGSWDFDWKSGKGTFSAEMYRLFGLDPREPPPPLDKFLELLEPEDTEVIRTIHQGLPDQQAPAVVEYRLKPVNGEQKYIRAVIDSVRDAEGNLIGAAGTALDITEAKQAEDALRISEERFRAFMAHSPAAGCILDEEGRIEWVSDSFYRMMGIAGPVEGRTLSELFPPEVANLYLQNDAAALAAGRAMEFTEPIQRPDGTVGERLSVKFPLHLPGRRPLLGVLALDVTAWRNMEQQLLRSQRMESLGTLASGIAHDLNNALNPVMTALGLLSLTFPDPKSQELLSLLSTSVQRAADMVRQLLSFGRGVAGRRMEVQIKHLVQEVQRIANDTFLKVIEIRAQTPGDTWLVMGDPTQIQQVLLNLCVNARDAMPQGGTLSIIVRNRMLDGTERLDVNAKPGAYVVVEVRDTGTGIPPEIMDSIFDPFFTTKEIGKGTGLGLSTSLGIVKNHGGFIHVESKPGEGSSFRVFLPAEASPARMAIETPAEPERSSARGELLLVIEDDPAVREVTRRTLLEAGYRVKVAVDGVEGVAAFLGSTAHIAAVITDMTMPRMAGAATITALRKLDSQVPIIAVSGLATTEAECREAGVTEFLAKPYTSKSLLKLIDEVLAQKRNRRS